MSIFGKPRKAKKIVVYEDKEGLWRWRCVARNGKIVAASEQGYSRRSYALSKAAAYAVPVVIVVWEPAPKRKK